MTTTMNRAGFLLGLAAMALALAFGSIAPSAAQEGTPHLMLQLKDGTVDIELMPDLAPKHVARIIELTDSGFYNGIVFHRVIPAFMAQTGDPTGTGMGGSDLPDVEAEFSDEQFVRGVLGAARTMDPDSFNSQFFIVLEDSPHLNSTYTVFGKVVSGMEFVDNIKPGSAANNGAVDDPDKIVAATIEYR